MRRFIRVALVLGVVAVLGALLRAVFGGRTEPDGTSAVNASTGTGGGRTSPEDAGRSSSGELTREKLYEQAKRLGIEGRSKMNKRDLQQAVARRRGAS